MNEDMVKYYRDRAGEYERIYAKPERKLAIGQASAMLQEYFSGKSVLEIACGTGFWTEIIAGTAAEILASDINQTVLEIAKAKSYANGNTAFVCQDMYGLAPEASYDALFAGFIWSHIPLEELDTFIGKANSLVQPGSRVVLMDNIYVEGSNSPLCHTDSQGNTYQARRLANGSEHLVLKNFPTGDFLKEKISHTAGELTFINLEYFWMLAYTTNAKDQQQQPPVFL